MFPLATIIDVVSGTKGSLAQAEHKGVCVRASEQADDTKSQRTTSFGVSEHPRLLVYCSASRHDPCLASPAPTKAGDEPGSAGLRIAGALVSPPAD